VWQLTHGRQLKRNEFVCHTCDNPSCCEPSHLWLGDHRSNQQDKVIKGRNVPPKPQLGVQNPEAKLTDAQVVVIRERYATGEVDQASLAAEFNVSKSLIGLITNGKVWSHVSGPRMSGVGFRHAHRL
jgi:hypothetical protein